MKKFLLVILVSTLTQIAKSDTSTSIVYEKKKVEKKMVDGKEVTSCPAGDKKCVLTVTLHNDGHWSSTVSDGVSALIPLNPTPYTEGAASIDEVLHSMGMDLLSGAGVEINE